MNRWLVPAGVTVFLASCSSAPRSSSAALAPPPAPPPALASLVGEYRHDGDVVVVAEYGGALRALTAWYLPIRRRPVMMDQPEAIRVGGVSYPRRSVGPSDGGQLKITPVRPVPGLIQEALRATPPAQPSGLRAPDLVELTALDSTIHLDIRYATSNNFAGTVFYSQARAFLQRPAAEALVRAHRWLRARGYGLLIHDGYRPWYVTKVFWDAVPDSVHWMVANPAQGSRHNRGSAVDLTLYDFRTGQTIEMPGTYDEATRRSFPSYPGGTSRQRWHRELLRAAMEGQGFVRNPEEWWHFDYRDWRQYPILNLRFEEIGP
jgi:D-alanyl-D-alanine dipeptidase